jgi:hypothetical protein
METVTLDPGESTAFMFFSRMSADRASALAGTDVFESLTTLTAAGLLEGIPAEITFANWENVVVLGLETVASGNWNDAATWDGTVPTAAHVTAIGPHSVLVAEEASALSMAIGDAEAQLTISAGTALSVTGNAEVTAGKLSIESTGALNVGGSFAMATGTEFVSEVGETAAGAIAAEGNVDLAGALELRPNGASMFKAGPYTLITAAEPDGVRGTFDVATGLNQYVSTGDADDGLVYAGGEVVLTIDYDLHPGDADLNTRTNVQDFNSWNASKFADRTTTWAEGDFDGNGKTNILDFNIWNANKFTAVSTPAPPTEGQVPEPASLTLLVPGLVALALLVRRRRSG